MTVGVRAQTAVAERIALLIAIHRDQQDILLSFDQVWRSMLGLKLRRREAQQQIRGILRAAGRCRWDGPFEVARMVDGIGRLEIPPTRAKLAEALARIATRPLTPRLVLEVLAISSAERVRWTKDGRLPRSGATIIKRGSLIAVPTYAVAMIEDLIAKPATITSWRQDDAASRKYYVT
jgi:hypothetical protein